MSQAYVLHKTHSSLINSSGSLNRQAHPNKISKTKPIHLKSYLLENRKNFGIGNSPKLIRDRLPEHMLRHLCGTRAEGRHRTVGRRVPCRPLAPAHPNWVTLILDIRFRFGIVEFMENSANPLMIKIQDD